MMRSKYGSALAVRQEVAEYLRPPRRMPVAEGVRQYMFVPRGANTAVPWDDTLTPYMNEAINTLSKREYDAVIFAGPARTGKTLGLIDGWIVYSIVCDPADMLVVQMTETKAREHSKTRLARTFHHSPEVRKRLSPSRNDNNVHDKMFRDGSFLKIGWPSITVFSSSDYKRVALTDYDRFPEDIDGEGDGFSLASKRTTTFMSAGMTLAESSPGREITDVKWRRSSPHEAPPTTGILSLYNRGDRRRWYWPCPHCGGWFQPAMENMVGYRDNPDLMAASEAARIQCPHCLALIQPEQKRELNNRGVWLKEGQLISRDGEISGEARRSRIASFWMEGPAAAYQTWQQLVYKLLTAEEEYERTGSEETLKAVINTDWGLPYLPRISLDQRKAETLIARAEKLPPRRVPDGVRFLVATVDVQGGKKRRFVVQVVGYGSHGERWIVDRFNITRSLRCDESGEALQINPGAYPEDWHLLITDVLERAWPLVADPEQEMGVLCMGVDSGGEDGVTDNAYAFWRHCRREGVAGRVYLFKGDSTARSKIFSKSYPNNTGRSDRQARACGEVPLYLLQTNALKDRIASALDRKEPGANYVHIPDWLGDWFFEELTYEERGMDGKWTKPGKGANEALDLLCYAHALVMIRGYERINWDNPPAWARLPEQLAHACKHSLTTAPDSVADEKDTDEMTEQHNTVVPFGGVSGGGWL
ncbi:phage terminase large subunit family protein [Citrobacter freundii]|nr:phage terminase large subunit family protein [Citrobacter freundii]